ncbi:hypothetical protein V5E97_02710 [Singulisphaera sp. Ch08]|uniref:NfeD-like C-terminal domain-containing protein n=1 Tax=Singulisphaera sp. Ch08 TaxID=3120278 RepID=A0AAU7CI51_9BACT
MYQFFLICATIGGTILLLRLALSLVGLGSEGLGGIIGDLGDAEFDADLPEDASADSIEGGYDHGHHLELGRIFTFQAIVSFLAFFGIGGLTALEAKPNATVAVLVGTATGVVTVSLLGYALRLLRKLNSDGTVRIAQSVGLGATVYLRIPANGGGEGKITLPIQGRTIEVLARTPGPSLRTGDPVVVSRVIDEQIVEVVAPQDAIFKPAPFPE